MTDTMADRTGALSALICVLIKQNGGRLEFDKTQIESVRGEVLKIVVDPATDKVIATLDVLSV